MSIDHPTIALDPIPGFPGYLACRLGVVFSIRYRQGGTNPRPLPLKSRPDKDGYLVVGLWKNGERYQRHIHKLILETYVGPRPVGMECRHINSIQTENRFSNLMWATHQANVADRVECGMSRGERNHNAKLRNDDIIEIRKMTAQTAAKKYGIHRDTARSIIIRESWRHVP